MASMTGGEAAVAALRALGVEHVFGIVSVHNLPIADAISRRDDITFVPVRHEQGAAHAADGYARASGRLGVALTSTGPGAANAMNGLFEAGFASSPVLMITGQIESRWLGKGKGVLHEAEHQLEMLRTVTRRAESVRSTALIADAIVRAGVDAQTGRPQPTAVEIPIDLQYASAEVSVPSVVIPKMRPDAADVERIATLLSGAERPVIWAGGGVIRSGAAADLMALAERLGAPVVTSINGRGSIPDDHPLALGALTITTPIGEIIGEADVLLAVGTRFQGGATRDFQLRVPSRLIHVDADASVIDRNYPAEVRIVADAGLAVRAITDALGSGEPASDAEFVSQAREAGATARNAARMRLGTDHEKVMNAIRHFLPRDGIIVRDATVPAYLWGDRLLPVYEQRTSMHPTSAAIGPGLPLAIGAAMATRKRTVLIQGDGGFMLNLGELATAVQQRLPIVVCVFNDGGYGVLRAIQARTFEGRQTAVDLTTPDFAALADAVGMRSEPVEGVDGFLKSIAFAMEEDGPTLLDIDMGSLAPLAGFGPRA